MRTCVLDIETTGLKSDFGRVICGVIKEYGTRREAVSYVPKNYLDDSKCLLKIRDRLNQFDIVVTHYGKGFDIPFLNSRLFQNGEERVKKMFHVDTYYIAKHKLKTQSRKSLKSLGDTLQLGEQKMGVPRWVWNGARDGSRECIEKLVDRCVSDVLMTEELYTKMLVSGLIDTVSKY